jgi:hypothetical protein
MLLTVADSLKSRLQGLLSNGQLNGARVSVKEEIQSQNIYNMLICKFHFEEIQLNLRMDAVLLTRAVTQLYR